MKKNILLVIANTVQAKIYQATGHEYKLVKELKHPQSRLKTKALESDKPGHYKTSHTTHGSFSSANPHEAEHIHFAKMVADFVTKSVDKRHDQHIILCAEPHFYGLIRRQLPTPAKDLVRKVIEKDYIPFPEAKLNETIKNIIHEHQ